LTDSSARVSRSFEEVLREETASPRLVFTFDT
jgi:hypothetical protein